MSPEFELALYTMAFLAGEEENIITLDTGKEVFHTEGLGPVQTSVFRDVFNFFRFFGRAILRSVEPLDSRASFLSIKSTHLNLKVSSDCQLLPSITQ